MNEYTIPSLMMSVIFITSVMNVMSVHDTKQNYVQADLIGDIGKGVQSLLSFTISPVGTLINTLFPAKASQQLPSTYTPQVTTKSPSTTSTQDVNLQSVDKYDPNIQRGYKSGGTVDNSKVPLTNDGYVDNTAAVVPAKSAEVNYCWVASFNNVLGTPTWTPLINIPPGYKICNYNNNAICMRGECCSNNDCNDGSSSTPLYVCLTVGDTNRCVTGATLSVGVGGGGITFFGG
jgi:hypothetical protein